MTLLKETAHPSTDTSTREEVPAEAPVAQETLPPYLRLLYYKSVNGLRQMHESFSTERFPTEWSQGYPQKEGPVDFELPFDEYENGENPWSLVARRMFFDWGGFDKHYNNVTQQGELRKGTDIVAKVDFSNNRKPIIQVRLGSNLQGSLQNLNDIFGAMASAHKKVVGDLAGREDSPSRNKLYVLQVANPRSGFAQAA